MLMKEKASTLEELERDAIKDEMEMQRSEMMKKGDIIRSLRQSHVERREAEEKERQARVEEARELRNRQIERTYKLAGELSRLKNLEAQELLETRRSRQASRCPTACAHQKERVRMLEEKVHAEEDSARIIKYWYENESFDEIHRRKVEEKKLRYRADLQNQIIEKRRILRELDEEKQRERKNIEEATKVMHEEDVREEERRKEIRSALQSEKELFLEARKRWKEILKATLYEENKKIGEIIAEKEALHKKQMEEKSDILKAREKLTENMARKMLDEEIKMKEREDICNELFLEEKKIEEKNRAMRRVMKKKLQIVELHDAMEAIKIAKAERKRKEIESDVAFSEYLKEEQRKLNEQDRIKKENRRQKTKQYGKELMNIISDNKIKYAVQLLDRQREIQMSECGRNETPSDELSTL